MHKIRPLCNWAKFINSWGRPIFSHAGGLLGRILKVKQFIENVNYEEVKKISDEILNQDDSVRIKQILKSYYDKIYSVINN